jgi:hypothetical protein
MLFSRPLFAIVFISYKISPKKRFEGARMAPGACLAAAIALFGVDYFTVPLPTGEL